MILKKRLILIIEIAYPSCFFLILSLYNIVIKNICYNSYNICYNSYNICYNSYNICYNCYNICYNSYNICYNNIVNL